MLSYFIKKHKPKTNLLGLCFFFFLFCSSVAIAQEYSEDYLLIKNDTLISHEQKELKIDSLFRVYEETSQFEILVVDRYDFAKWQNRSTSVDHAIETCKKNVARFESLDSDFNENIYKRTINNLGFYYSKKQDYLNAYKAFKKATKVGKTDRWTSNAYRLTGRNLKRLGDFYKAAEYYETSIEVANQIDNLNAIVANSIDAGINYKLIGTTKSTKRGIEILQKAVQLVEANQNSLSENRQEVNTIAVFDLYNHLGNLFNEKDDFDFENSKKNYDKALQIANRLDNPTLRALVNNDLGYLYLHDNHKLALDYFTIAQTFESSPSFTSTVFENKSIYYSNSKDYKKALQNIQRAIHAIAPVSLEDYTDLPTKESISTNYYKNELLKDLIRKGLIWLSFYNDEFEKKQYLINALETLQLADYLVDVIRYESDDQQSKLFWRKTASKIYTNAVRASFHLNKPDQAFYFMEKNKALLLLEDVSMQQQIETAGIPAEITNRRFKLLKQISDYKALVDIDASKKDSIRPFLLKAKDVYNTFLDSLVVNYNIYSKTQKAANIIRLDHFQNNVIGDDEIYISYILGEADGFGLAVTKSNVEIFSIEDHHTLTNLSKKYKTFLEEPLKSKEELDDYQTTSNALYTILIPPQIQPLIPDKKITFVPDSYLQNIPFEALQTSPTPGSYFIRSNDISYAYSISFLEQNKRVARQNEQLFLGFAPVDFNGMSSLTESKKEIDFVASQFSATTFLFDQATKQNFLENSASTSIIHLASHANASNTSNPWIAFKDKKLTLDELYLTKNSADLVVLSACETSLGTLNQGEGVMSLSRGFFNTGTNSVLSTLWNVNDKSTSKIIIDFYKQLKKGKTKSDALRQAKLNYLDTHKLSELSPHYWSSLILIGDANHLPIKQNNTLLYILLVLFSVLIISYLAYRKQKI